VYFDSKKTNHKIVIKIYVKCAAQALGNTGPSTSYTIKIYWGRENKVFLSGLFTLGERFSMKPNSCSGRDGMETIRKLKSIASHFTS
jgi:hypothetical protein